MNVPRTMLFYLAALLLAFCPSWTGAGNANAGNANLSLSVGRTDPGLSGVLGRGETLYIEVFYDSPSPVRFQVLGIRNGEVVTRGAMMNPAPPYAAGSGAAQVWVAYREAVAIDHLRITAYDENWSKIGTLNVPASLQWGADAPAPARETAAWARDMSARQQQMTTDGMLSAGSAGGDMVVGWLISGVFILALPLYLFLQIRLPALVSGRWRIAAFAPLAVMAPVGLYTLFALLSGANLWPLTLIFTLPIALVWLLLVAGLHAAARP